MNLDQKRGFERAEGRLRAGAPGEALAILRPLAAAVPDNPAIWWALGNAYGMAGDAGGAEAAFRQVARLDPERPNGWAALADLLASLDRGEEAIAMLEPVLAARRDPRLLATRGRVWRTLGRMEAAADDFAEAARATPGVAGLEYDLAMAAGSLNRGPETEGAARRALAAGLRRPEVQLLIGHGQRVQGRLDAAEATFREGLAHWPDHEGLHRELGYLVWARTGDVGAATAAIDAVLARSPGQPGLLVLKARLLEYAQQPEAAAAVLAGPAARPDAPSLVLSAAARLAPPREGADLARRALAAQPDDPFALSALAEALLADGRPDEARDAVEQLLALAPEDEHGRSLQRLVWRLTDDLRYRDAYDYPGLVSTRRIDTPPGWPSLEAYLADLAAALRGLHDGKAHPVGQSLRGGTQTNKTLSESDEPAIRAFFQAVQAPIAAHVAMLDAREGRTAATPHRIARSWSVRLSPGGRHVDHMHKAWISSAFYVALPAEVEAGGRAGWLRFGKPGIATSPPVEAEHWVKPEPGLLALFPAYMWHGTEPFEAGEERLTIAFDVDPL
ncbi:tetratricopeptide repeat protein [Caulobacter sp. SLTY]|uniref:tetratricopeptide repeat protein n=1 Tax=Caulobacter sp. SLTY TaxID=2683262 RepID=UPI001413186F|nr:tetratricopeptide repeat protein [Caulobacter sp. SLTY]NBB14858.1 tetratricopeptide repeat protein [Caulobacter sp. SLTY]